MILYVAEVQAEGVIHNNALVVITMIPLVLSIKFLMVPRN